MTRRLVVPAALFCALALALTGAADPPKDEDFLGAFPHPKGYVCYRAPAAVAIDGDLSDDAWKAAPWSDDFVDIEGDKKPKPKLRTRMKMMWDAEALYIAAELEEPHVWGTLKEHDSVIFLDNDFEAFIDPDGDNHDYGELELNALNTTWDLLLTKPYKDGGRAVNAWEIPGLRTAVKVNGTLNNPGNKDTGWTVEIKWPWKAFGELVNGRVTPVPPKDGNKWRVNFSRVQWDTVVKNGKYEKVPNRPEYNWVWSPQGVIDMHRPERWGYVQFSDKQPGTVAFEKDAGWDIADALHRAYYAQRVYHQKNKKFAAKADDLALKGLPAGGKLNTDAAVGGPTVWWTDAEGKVGPRVTADGRFLK